MQFTEYVRLFFLLERGIVAQKHKIGVISSNMYVSFSGSSTFYLF